MAFLSVIVFSALNCISFTKALLICLGFLLLCKFIKLDEIKRRFPFDIFIIVGSSLATTKVLVDSGLAKDLAQLITGFFWTLWSLWKFYRSLSFNPTFNRIYYQ